MSLIYVVPYQQYFSHLQGWKTNSDTAAPIYQETINKMISSYDFSFINLYLSTASDKCLRYTTSNKSYLFIHCSFFVGIFLKTTELIQRQFINILKTRIIVFIQTVQIVLISDMNGLLIMQQSFVNILLNRCYIYIA